MSRKTGSSELDSTDIEMDCEISGEEANRTSESKTDSTPLTGIFGSIDPSFGLLFPLGPLAKIDIGSFSVLLDLSG